MNNENTLLTMGEVLDNLKHGLYGTSIDGANEGVIFLDKDGWLVSGYLNKGYVKHGLDLRYTLMIKDDKCWMLRELDDEMKDTLEGLELKDVTEFTFTRDFKLF